MNEIIIKDQVGDAQNMLYRIVEKAYPIKNDDASFRKLLKVKDTEREILFRRLRNQYPMRRDFKSTQVMLNNNDPVRIKKITGIGFHVSQ
jgi:hypothetical protein